MIFKFKEGERVALKMDYSDLLPAGSEGTIFCMYHATPPAYEVTLRTADGRDYGAIMEEADLASVPQTAPSVQETVASIA